MAMRFVKVTDPRPAIDYLTAAIRQRLDQGRPVLWFVSGGSAIPLEAEIARAFVGRRGLTVTLTDERPGPVGHADSNAKQLHDAGFALPFHEILTGGDPAADAESFADYLQRAYAKDPFCIGLFGIGADGHTAGIPHANAPSASGLAAAYAVGQFRRISMTPAAIARLDEIVVIAMGEAKRPALEQLERDEPITAQSAQALKAGLNIIVFNEVKGESA